MFILISILVLAFMDSLLSFDNAVALAILVKPLPKEQHRKALTYGIVGAFVFRIIAVYFAVSIIESVWLKVIGGSYLLYLGITGMLGAGKEEDPTPSRYKFWRTVALVEITDIIFSIDSIMAGVAFSSNIWVIILGGVIGICMMRFASTVFIDLIQRFPNLEKTSFFLIIVVGLKLMSQIFWTLNYESVSTECFLFWALIIGAIGYGFTRREHVVVHSK